MKKEKSKRAKTESNRKRQRRKMVIKQNQNPKPVSCAILIYVPDASTIIDEAVPPYPPPVEDCRDGGRVLFGFGIVSLLPPAAEPAAASEPPFDEAAFSLIEADALLVPPAPAAAPPAPVLRRLKPAAADGAGAGT